MLVWHIIIFFLFSRFTKQTLSCSMHANTDIRYVLYKMEYKIHVNEKSVYNAFLNETQ